MSDHEAQDWNAKIIAEFRANGGIVGGHFDGAPLLLLHSTGARTSAERVTPVMYQPLEPGYAVFATKAGAPTNPDWYHNLRANPQTTVEIGTKTVEVIARVTEGDERREIWERQKRDRPDFAKYEASTTREIPVVILQPR